MLILQAAAPPYQVELSTTTLSKSSPQTLAYSRAVGLVDEKSGASINIIVENFLVKHKNGAVSQVGFAPAPSDTIELSIVQALAALVSEKFTTPTDADQVQTAGKYNTRWDGKDNAGQNVASGIYLAKIKAGALHGTIKMTLVR